MQDIYTSTQSARPVWNLNGRGIVTEQEASPKLWRHMLPEGILQKSFHHHTSSWMISPCAAVPLKTCNVGCIFSKLNCHQGSKSPEVCPRLSRIPKTICQSDKWRNWSPQRDFQTGRVSWIVLVGVELFQDPHGAFQPVVVTFVSIFLSSGMSHVSFKPMLSNWDTNECYVLCLILINLLRKLDKITSIPCQLRHPSQPPVPSLYFMQSWKPRRTTPGAAFPPRNHLKSFALTRKE